MFLPSSGEAQGAALLLKMPALPRTGPRRRLFSPGIQVEISLWRPALKELGVSSDLEPERAPPARPRPLPGPEPRSGISARLIRLGFAKPTTTAPPNGPTLRLAINKLPKVVGELTREGWFVEAEGKLYRQPGEFKVAVKSGIDWFELHGEVSFGDQSASLPKLLAALRRGENSVRLDDGTFGLLPQEWLKKYAPLAGIGEGEDDHLRFNARQVGFLDALLAGVPQATFDETFTRVRDELMRFDGIRSMEAPVTFQGTLARISARAWDGWSSSADSISAGASPTTWALARQFRSLLCWSRADGECASLRLPAKDGRGRREVGERRGRHRWWSPRVR